MTFIAPPFDADLLARLLALNNDHAEELSYQSPEQFHQLLQAASVVRAGAQGLALMVAFHRHCHYDNANFRWLQNRFDRFIYIDRVVVSAKARGQGLATKLYDTLEQIAQDDGSKRLVCEINAVPANPQSDAFHVKLDFTAVGERMLEGLAKTVRYWAKELS